MPAIATGIPTGLSSNIPMGGCWYRVKIPLTTRFVDVLTSVTELVRIEAKATGSKYFEGLTRTLAA
jgi:hypothetical protein